MTEINLIVATLRTKDRTYFLRILATYTRKQDRTLLLNYIISRT